MTRTLVSVAAVVGIDGIAGEGTKAAFKRFASAL
jgi:hypothetical protein